MGIIQAESGAIGADIVAPGAGSDETPILFLHGVGSDRSVWRPQLEHFGKTRTAIAIDYPGYGDSLARDGVGRDGFALAATEVLDALDIDRAHICGLSLGGVVAIALHANAPERCASLVLADTFAAHPDGLGIHQRSVAGSEDMRAMATARVPLLVDRHASEALRAELIEVMARIDPAAFRQGAEAVWLADQLVRVAAIDVPTLVIVGSEDKVTPPALSEALARMIPGARLVEIAEAGHLTNIERPEEFNAAVDAFLTEKR
jgi:3-oxoadipate enol-lactonase